MPDDCQPCDAKITGNKCPGCGETFACDLAKGCTRCWCMDLPPVVPVDAAASCLCQNCLKAEIERIENSAISKS